ncbi:MAG: hypothetical protein Alpg2KO_02940 [Alphaproteobacteria bacterium]
MWVPLALLTGVGWAAVVLVNQQVRMPGKQIMLWRGLVMCGVLLPVSLFCDWPHEMAFYGWCITLGLIVGIYDFIVFNVARDHGAGVTTRTMPAGILVSFSIWIAFHEADRLALFAEPWRAAGVVLCLVGVVMSMWFVRKNPVNRAAFKALAPVILMTGMLDVMNKMAVTSTEVPMFDRVILYALIVSASSGVVTAVQITTDPQRKQIVREAFQKKQLIGGCVLITAMLLAMMTKAPAMADAPNPAYVGALMLTGAIWVVIFNRIRKVPDHSSIKAGLFFLACIACLLLLKA